MYVVVQVRDSGKQETELAGASASPSRVCLWGSFETRTCLCLDWRSDAGAGARPGTDGVSK